MEFNWNPEKATLLLYLPKTKINEQIVEFANKNGYQEKSEIHLTILSFQNGKKILQNLSASERGEILEKIYNLAKSYKWNMEYLHEYFVLERTINEFVLQGIVQTPKHTRRTIIQKVTAPDLELFLEKVSANLGVYFEKPFPHVTLFTWSDVESQMMEGIGLNSESDFEKYKVSHIEL